MKDKLQRALKECIPVYYAKFYKNAPKEITYDYIVERIDFDEFIDLSKRTWLFDVYFMLDAEGKPIKNELAYKEPPDLFIQKAFCSVDTVLLYRALPKEFSAEDYTRIRRSLKIKPNCQSKLTFGKFFKYSSDKTGKITYYWKTGFKPTIK